MRKEFKKSFLKELKRHNAELLQIKKEIDLLIDKKNDLEERIEDLNNILSLGLTKAEGDTISYKLGRVILEAKTLRGFFSLPSSLWSVYRYKQSLSKLNNKPKLTEQSQVISKVVANEAKSRNVASLQTDNKLSIANDVILTLLDKYSILGLSKLYKSYNLIPSFEGQVANSKAFAFFLDSHWISRTHDWDYALVSKNFSNHQGGRLEKALKMLKDRKIPIVFYYKHPPQYLENFKPLLKYVDYFITNNSISNRKVLDGFKASVYIPGIVDSTVFNLSLTEKKEKNDTIAYFIDYKNSFVRDFVFSKSEFLNDIQKDVTIYKKKSTYTQLSVPVLDLSDDLLPQEYASILKNHKFSLYIANPSENYVPQNVIDSLAVGTPVISTHSDYLKEKYPGIIQFANSQSEMQAILSKYQDKWAYLHLAHKGYRGVINSCHFENIKHVLSQYILKKEPKKDMTISIIMATMREKYIDRVLENLARQNYKNKEIIFVTQNFTPNGILKLKQGMSKLTGYFNTKVIENNSEITLGERLNLAAQSASGDLIAKMDDDDFYFENYLSDMVLPFKCGDYAVVGKAENFVYLEGLDQTVLLREGRAANREMEFVAGPTLVIKKTVFDRLEGFLPLNRGEDSTLIKRVLEQGGKVYSSDPFNFIQFRSNDVTAHTWQQKAEAFAKSGTYIANGMATNIVRV